MFFLNAFQKTPPQTHHQHLKITRQGATFTSRPKHSVNAFDFVGNHQILSHLHHSTGVPEAERQRIFEPFYRVAGAAESGRGSGLGLALVLDIARRHGGDAVCLAAEGGGSRFRVDLPAA